MMESLKLSKAERVHSRIFYGVQCTWQSADDKTEGGGVLQLWDMSKTIREKGETTVNLTQGDTRRRWKSFKFQIDGQERAVALSSGNSYMWRPIREFTFTVSWEHKVE